MLGFGALDWLVIAAYFAVLFGLAVWVVRKKTESSTDYFLAGRHIGWFVIGRFVLIFVIPFWKMMLDRAPSTQDDSTGGSPQPPAQDAEPD